MKATTIVLITAAPVGLLLWLFWRRRPRKQEDSSGQRLATAEIAAEENNIEELQAECPAEPALKEPSLAKTEEKSHGEAGGDRELELPAALAAVAGSQSESEPERIAQPIGESDLSAEALQRAQAETAKRSSPADSSYASSAPAVEILPEPRSTANDIDDPTTNDYCSTEQAAALPAASETVSRDSLQSDQTGPSAEPVPIGIQPNDQLVETNGDAGHPPVIELPEENDESNTESVPKRYRPPPQRPPGPAAKHPAIRESKRGAPVEVLLGISVQLKFDRSGFCETALLPERTADLDNEVAVTCGRKPLRLFAQEDWYEDLPLDDIGDLLRQGLELKGPLADGRSARWLLTGRDLYVLATHPRASRLVSTSRLALGRAHVVLCTAELLQSVESILVEAGCQGYTKLDGSHGVPSGWVALRDVAPAKALPLAGTDPFYAIKPAPDIEIDFEGGLCLRNSVWLAGYPPRIKILGESNLALRVLIDGKEARHSADGSFIVDGYDIAGPHSVYCDGASVSRSYSIEEPLECWPEWPAHPFWQAEICGPLVRLKPEAAGRRAITVPMSNPVLLGAKPGQIFRCPHRNVTHWRGYVPFDVVWALPSYPLIYNKKTGSIIQIANAPVVPERTHVRSALGWCSAILDVSRKRLQIENESPESKACWNEYKKTARNIWRAAR